MSADDYERVLSCIVALCGDPDRVQSVVMLGAPASKARPRFGKGGHTYTPAESRQTEQRTRDFLKRHFHEPYTGNVALALTFHRPNLQRVDVDNMIKHVCDAANGVLWIDDSQVTAILAVAEFDPLSPRTVLAVAPHVSTLQRGSDAVAACGHCGTSFSTRSVSSKKRFCTPECAQAARVNARPLVECRQCNEPFRRTTNRQILCSENCRAEWLRGRNRAEAQPNSTCTDCGRTLTHKRGGRCRDCWRRSPHAVPAATPRPLPHRLTGEPPP